MRLALSAALLAATSGHAVAAQAASDYRLFVACPVYRDTDSGRKSGCWLAQSPDDGVQYDVTLAPAKPDYAHAALIEGRVAARQETGQAGQDNPCGGIVLDPVSVSILEAPCPRYMIPAEGYPGRRFALPVTNVPPLDMDRPLDKEPFARRSFPLFFEFDSSFISYQFTDYYLDKLAHWLRSAHPRRIVVTGYGATRPVTVSGKAMAERSDVARERAETVAQSLRMLGFDARTISTRVGRDKGPDKGPIEDDTIPGLSEYSRRRVEVTAEF